MTRQEALATVAAGAAFVASGARARADEKSPLAGFELAFASMSALGNGVYVREFTPGVWVHSTLAPASFGNMYANGLVVDRERDAILVDTGWEPHQTATLLAWSAARGKPVALGLSTHFHVDRIGGAAALVAASIPLSANPLTVGLAMEHGFPAPIPLVGVDAAPQRFADVGEAFFPGAGHSRDNLTLALPERSIVFGGCLVRSISATSLGNIDDAVLADWDGSMRALQVRYRNTAAVIPGHGKIGGDAIGHTLNLVAASGHGV